MARKSTSFVDDLLSLPWWVSATLGLAGYGVFGFMLPWVSGLSRRADHRRNGAKRHKGPCCLSPPHDG